VTLNFDLLISKSYHFEYIPTSFAVPSLNTLGSFVFELCCGQTNKQTDRQTDGLKRATLADRHSSRE